MAWVKLDDGFPEHPKVEAAGDLAGWLFISALCYSNRAATDGFVPEARIPKLTGLARPRQLAEDLVAAGLFEQVQGGYRIHDYHEYQPQSAKRKLSREELSRARSEAGRRGAAAKWGSTTDGKTDGKSMASAIDKEVATDSKADGPVPVPDPEGDSLAIARESGSVAIAPELVAAGADDEAGGGENRDGEQHPEGERLCNLLADLIKANGTPPSRIKWPSKGWRTEARLMLEKDKRPVAQAEQLIRWCQQDQFWKSNILSMPKFREQYDQLRLKAKAEQTTNPTRRTRPDTAAAKLARESAMPEGGSE